MNNSTSRPLRILYAAGPGDILYSYEHWRQGRDVPTETSITFSGQFFDFARQIGASALVICSHPRRGRVHDGPFILENRPKRLANARGPLYHLSQLFYALSLIGSALRFRANLVIVDSGTTHWFALAPLALFGIAVIPSLHNALWPSGFVPRGMLRRIIGALDGFFWRRIAAATICVSPELQRQVQQLATSTAGPIFQYFCQFRRGALEQIPPPSWHPSQPLRIMFAGRVERDKGVFDLLAIAQRLQQLRPGRIRWEVCGGGSALEELARQVNQQNLADCIHLAGKLDRAAMCQAYARAHLVIVPTTSRFCEGMPMVAAEAVLAGRPVLTTRLANALDVLHGALIEAQPDDIDSYVAAIDQLLEEPNLYNQYQRGCADRHEQFYNPRYGLTAALMRVADLITTVPQPDTLTPAPAFNRKPPADLPAEKKAA